MFGGGEQTSTKNVSQYVHMLHVYIILSETHNTLH